MALKALKYNYIPFMVMEKYCKPEGLYCTPERNFSGLYRFEQINFTYPVPTTHRKDNNKQLHVKDKQSHCYFKWRHVMSHLFILETSRGHLLILKYSI